MQHAAQLNGQPALVEHERRLREKITILCLLDLISSVPPDQRTLALSTVAERTKLPPDGVEFLLMKARLLQDEQLFLQLWTRVCLSTRCPNMSTGTVSAPYRRHH